MRVFSAATRGFSPENVALILALGFVLGTFPVFGFPTLLCVAAAFTFRVNLPALQVVNNLSTPAQLVLMAPLARMGARIFHVIPGWNLGMAALHAITGWLCVCVPAGIAIYFPLAYALRRSRPGGNKENSPGNLASRGAQQRLQRDPVDRPA